MDELMRTQKIKVNFVVEIRFVRGDDSWLSPAYGRDSCFIGCFMHGEKFWPEYSAGFEKICARYGGRPHWGKDFSLTAGELAPLYPRWEDFFKLRNRLDPERRWANPWLNRVLGE
jgi:FAD/FMN-containing dehydrogenase